MKKYTSLTKNSKENGFVAFITAFIVSMALLLSALTFSQGVGYIFDEVTRKQYRTLAAEAAFSCADHVFHQFEYDYFYTVEKPGIFYPITYCTVLSVGSTDSSDLNNPSSLRTVIVEGYSGTSSTTANSITAKVVAQVLIDSQNISLVSEITTFY